MASFLAVQSQPEDFPYTSIDRTVDVQVLLVSMPFGPLFQPSIGLGLLKAGLALHNISAKIRYFTLKFAERIGTTFYMEIANGKPMTQDLVGEWLFSHALFDVDDQAVERYVNDVLRGKTSAHDKQPLSNYDAEAFIQSILQVRSQIEPFLEECLQVVLQDRPPIVAFTSIFQQQLAALSLAKRIKAESPETIILLGGANCEGIMGVEVVRQFPFVDITVSGEGDIIFPQLIQRLLAHEPISDLQGVHTRHTLDRGKISLHTLNAPSVSDMNQLPYPDYSDFFTQLEQSRPYFDQNFQPHILFETSRGCWWGEKHHCTFCGLNGDTMNFRSKTADRALDELMHLINQYPNCRISVVDNILDLKYFKDFVPQLAARQLDLELFYEVKANLRKDQIRLLRDAGITTIQPGIESLSSQVLELMSKGIKGLQNVQLLKWCKELGVLPIWNILWGFPGEPATEYQRVTHWIPWLAHLQPPSSFTSLRVDRFSPNFEQPEKFGFTALAPYPSYFHVYPLLPEAVANLAYFFTFDYHHPQDVDSYTEPLRQALQAWCQSYPHNALFSVDKETHLLIWDLRSIASQPLHVLTGYDRWLYLSCDGIQTTYQLQQKLNQQTGRQWSEAELYERLQPLLERGLLLQEAGTYLGLAIPLGEYSPERSQLRVFRQLVGSLGEEQDGRVVIPLPAPNIQLGAAVSTERSDVQANLDPYRLTTDYFSVNHANQLVINTDAIARIEFNFVKLQLAGIAQPKTGSRS